MSLFCFTAAPGSISLSLVKGCTFGTFCVQDKKGGNFMLNFTAMIQGIDTIFTNFIFIPALLILYLKFRPRKPWNKRTRNLYRLCIALISVYVIRIFCAGFIFTPVNHVLQTAVSFRLSRHCSILRFSAILCHLVRIWE